MSSQSSGTYCGAGRAELADGEEAEAALHAIGYYLRQDHRPGLVERVEEAALTGRRGIPGGV
jgi:hypothetical protein